MSVSLTAGHRAGGGAMNCVFGSRHVGRVRVGVGEVEVPGLAVDATRRSRGSVSPGRGRTRHEFVGTARGSTYRQVNPATGLWHALSLRGARCVGRPARRHSSPVRISLRCRGGKIFHRPVTYANHSTRPFRPRREDARRVERGRELSPTITDLGALFASAVPFRPGEHRRCSDIRGCIEPSSAPKLSTSIVVDPLGSWMLAVDANLGLERGSQLNRPTRQCRRMLRARCGGHVWIRPRHGAPHRYSRCSAWVDARQRSRRRWTLSSAGSLAAVNRAEADDASVL